MPGRRSPSTRPEGRADGAHAIFLAEIAIGL